MKIIDGKILRSKMKNNSRLVLIVLILLVIGLTGCKDSGDGSLKAEDKNMTLVNQSHSFKGAPEELYFGEALQETFSDQGLDVKYLSSFNDGVATYLFLEIIDTGSNLFDEESNGNDFTLYNYDFLEKTGYTDSKLYGLISYDKKRQAATICVEYIGTLDNENISFHIYSLTGNQKLTGDWEIKFAIKNSLVKELDSNEAIPVKGEKLLVQRAVISPVNITLFASRKDVTEEQMDWFGRLYLEDFDVKILYKDKKTIDVPKQSGIFANQKGLLLRFVYTPENFVDIVGLEVNGVTFPVTGD